VAGQPDPSKPTEVNRGEFLAAADRLDAILAALGVVPHPTSWPARALRAVREVPPWAENHDCLQRGVPCPHMHESLARVQLAADLLVMVDLVEEVLRGGTSSTNAERLRLLAAGDHSATARGRPSGERNLVFELMCAGWLTRIATDVDLVDPPDVLSTYRGMRWGIACKNASGSAHSAFVSVKKGIEQLDQSPCEQGAVVVRITDVYPHEELVPGRSSGMRSIPSFQDGDQLFEFAMGLARPFVAEVIGHANGGASLFKRSRKLAMVIFVAHSVANMSSPEGAITTIVPIPNFLCAAKPPHPFMDDFITAFRL